jgi:hypothetical protein
MLQPFGIEASSVVVTLADKPKAEAAKPQAAASSTIAPASQTIPFFSPNQ